MTRFGNIWMCVCTVKRSRSSKTRRMESAKKVLKVKWERKTNIWHAHSSPSQPRWDKEVIQMTMNKSLFFIYTVLHKKQQDIQKLLLPSVVSQSFPLKHIHILSYLQKQSLPKSCSLASVCWSAFPRVVLCYCVFFFFFNLYCVWLMSVYWLGCWWCVDDLSICNHVCVCFHSYKDFRIYCIGFNTFMFIYYLF